MAMRKLKDYTPTRFMAPDSHYDKDAADYAVAFIESLCHTKGKWAGKPFELIDWQERIVRDIFGVLKPNGYRQFNTAYVEISKKQGKQLALDTPIPTPDGWKLMGEIQVGDRVFDENGKPCAVVALSAIDDTEQCYRITFRDGSYIDAGENHLWDAESIIGEYHGVQWTTGELYRRTIRQRTRFAGTKDETRSIVRFPVVPPLQCESAELPIDPYVYGFWLGNGNSVKPELTIRTSDIDDILASIPYEITSRWEQKGGGSHVFRIPALKVLLLKSFRDKVIRPEYLRASEEQRWALLQGLMDSDGAIGDRKAQSIYVSTIKPLAESVRELLWSLGIKNAMHEEPSTRYGIPTGETLYTIRFTTFDDQPTSRLHRKLNRKRERVKPTRSCFHYIADIAPIDHPVKMRCIQVDSASHQYLAGPSMVPTHNSELAAAIALLLTCADGEERAEVYGCAADRQQAAICYSVASDMVRYCPALAKRVKILDSVKRMVYMPTGGVYQVVSSEVGTKHGFNTSGVVFDELHIQPNRKLYDVMLRGSGDARMQPLYFLITTAGDNQNSICWEVHSKAKDLLEGRKHDPTFYPVIYGADEGDDWTDPKVWAKANPSLGITIGIDKVQDACNSAKENPAEENAFRQLRLNQWVKQTIRWMPMDKWDACNFPVDPESLKGRVCYGGLDLSSTTDITAFVLVFPPEDEDDKYIVLPYFWLPEDSIPLRVRRDHVFYDVWQQQGLINTTEGTVIHYDFVEKFIEDLGKQYNIKEIAFDRWGATQMVQDLDGMASTLSSSVKVLCRCLPQRKSL